MADEEVVAAEGVVTDGAEGVADDLGDVSELTEGATGEAAMTARRTRRTVAPQDVENWKRLYAKGFNTYEIAEMSGFSKSVIQARLNKAGVRMRPRGGPGGSARWSWKGGRRLRADGYVDIRATDSPRGYVLEHRLVMESVIGRPLMGHENVHHKNGNRADNRPENLELWMVPQPRGQRVADLIGA